MDTLRMYAIARNDIGMTHGKVCSQLGHAFLGAATLTDPAVLAEYHKDFPNAPGTKVALSGNFAALMRAREKAKELGIPHFLVVDSGCLSFFNGSPTITALGLGPIRRAQADKLTRKFKLIK